MSFFMMVPLAICVYEILSLILPLRVPAYAKILFSLLLLSGLLKTMLYRRTPTGFDIVELPYSLALLSSLAFNFVITAIFMLIAKDIAWLIWKLLARRPFPAHYASVIIAVIGVLATLWGTYEALRLPGVNKHDVTLKGLGHEFEGLKVAMLVDIHADTLTNRSVVQKIADMTNELEPDLILIPGDFVDGTVKSRKQDLEPLGGLKSKLGVYGVTGNHEYYFDYDNWMKELASLGINMLGNSHVVFTSGDARLALAGVPDPTGGRMGREAHDTERALAAISDDVPVILMDHQPGMARENSKHGVVLQVSGHTHGGQIPMIYTFVKRANRGYVRGWYDVEGMRLYVSPGTSQWNGFAMRLFDPSEITLFILHSDIETK